MQNNQFSIQFSDLFRSKQSLLPTTILSKKKWFNIYYLFDWLLALCSLIIIELIFGAYLGGIQPPERFKTYLIMGDATISFPSTPSIIPDYLLILLNTIIPIIIVLLFQIKYKSSHDIHHGILTWFETASLTICLTDILKVCAGRLRPDFLSRCKPSIDGSCSGLSLSEIRDGKLSFPSGHSSLSFACMTFCTLYLMGKLRVYQKRKQKSFYELSGGSPFWKIWICFLPQLLSCYIAISRTLDYHHNFSDILGGCILGIIVGVLCYFLNYPSLTNVYCEFPLNRYFILPMQKVSVGNNNNQMISTINGELDV
ncbi:hypothetical protein ABK040_009832 [Willaertia magna]